MDLPGRPLLYGTTENFLRCFGVSSVEGLPPLPQQLDEQRMVETTMDEMLMQQREEDDDALFGDEEDEQEV